MGEKMGASRSGMHSSEGHLKSQASTLDDTHLADVHSSYLALMSNNSDCALSRAAKTQTE